MNTPCEISPYKLHVTGYPRRRWQGRAQYVHRVAWMQKRGPIPEGMLVCHACDNRACVNVEHLFLGTHKDNSVDMASKQRGTYGEKNRHAKLSQKDVDEIRALKGICSGNELAERFGVTRGNIYTIQNNRSWKERS